MFDKIKSKALRNLAAECEHVGLPATIDVDDLNALLDCFDNYHGVAPTTEALSKGTISSPTHEQP